MCLRFEQHTDGLEVQGINYRLPIEDEKHKSREQLQGFIDKYQAYVRDLDLKSLEDEPFLKNQEILTSLKEPFVHNLFLDHKLSRFESLMREKTFNRMISFEDLRKSLDDDQIQKLLLREPTLSALQHDLSTSQLGNGDDSARHPPHSSHHLYSQFLAA